MVAAAHRAEGAAGTGGLSDRQAAKTNAVLADLRDGNAGVALHDDELAAGIAAPGSFARRSKSSRSQTQDCSETSWVSEK